MKDTVEGLPIAAGKTATIGYQRATIWERDSATMRMMAQLLGLSETDLDELFVYAAGVVV